MKSAFLFLLASVCVSQAQASSAAWRGVDWTIKPRPELRSDEVCHPLEQVAILSTAAIGTAYGAFSTLPEDVTNWPKKLKDSSLWENYRRHTKQLVMDGDHWAVNYIGHPYSGMAYYNMSRTCGRSPLQSFMFSVAMSTFWWEYGIEAFFEKPSLQDLFSTPIIGSLMGEAAYQAILAIEANDDRIFGSKRLGRSTKVFLDPFTSLLRAIKASGVTLSVSPIVQRNAQGEYGYGAGLRAIWRWQNGPKYLTDRCDLNEAAERGQRDLPRTAGEADGEYQRLFARGKFCAAAQFAARIELEKPEWIGRLGVRRKVLQALEAGHYLVDQFVEIERQRAYIGNNETEVTRALVGLTRSYVHHLPTRDCTEPHGVLVQANGRTLGFRQEAAMIAMLAAARLPDSSVLDRELYMVQRSLGHCPRAR